MNRSGTPLEVFTLAPDDPPDQLSRYLSSLLFTINGFGHQHDDARAECGLRVIGDFEIILYRSGTGLITIADRHYTCSTGDLLVVPPYVAHEIRTDPLDPHDNFWVHFDTFPPYERDVFARLLLPADGGYRLTVPESGEVARLMDLLAREMVRRPSGHVAAAAGLLRALLVAVIRLSRPQGVPLPLGSGERSEALDRALAYAMAHLHEDLGADDLASAARCSRSRLFELFRSRLGRTPMELVRWLRLRQAEQLLKTTTLTVGEVSDRVGIASPFHLSRLFKEQYGVSPTLYRRAYGRSGMKSGLDRMARRSDHGYYQPEALW